MRSMISIPGSLFFVMSSAPAKKYAGDARCASQDPSIQRCPIQSRLKSALGVRSSYVERNHSNTALFQAFFSQLLVYCHGTTLRVSKNNERHDGLWSFTVPSSSSRVFSAMEGGAMNTCLRVLKETKWILSFYYNLLSISQTTFRHCRVRFYAFFGQPLSKQLHGN